jgi:ABC-type uncharacterized transport system permease subunit
LEICLQEGHSDGYAPLSVHPGKSETSVLEQEAGLCFYSSLLFLKNDLSVPLWHSRLTPFITLVFRSIASAGDFPPAIYGGVAAQNLPFRFS